MMSQHGGVKGVRRYIVNGVTGVLVYAPGGRRGYHWGKTSYQHTHTLYVQDSDRRKLFSLRLKRPQISWIKAILEATFQGVTTCIHCRRPSYLANKLEPGRDTGYWECEHCGHSRVEEQGPYDREPRPVYKWREEWGAVKEELVRNPQ